MSQSESMRELGFTEPDNVGQSEYRAMHEVIDDVIDQYDIAERPRVAITILEEFVAIAQAEIKRLQGPETAMRVEESLDTQAEGAS